MPGLFQYNPTVGLGDVAQTQLDSIVRATPFPRYEDQPDAKASMQKCVFDKLAKAWLAFKGPVKNVNHFIVTTEMEDGWVGIAEYIQGDIHVYALPEDAVDFSLGIDIAPTRVRRAEVRTGGNSKCPCGSGKKYKRCCGAFA